MRSINFPGETKKRTKGFPWERLSHGDARRNKRKKEKLRLNYESETSPLLRLTDLVLIGVIISQRKISGILAPVSRRGRETLRALNE